MARGLLREQLVLIYYLEKCPLYTSLMNTAERLHRNSHLSVPLAITEAIRLYKQELNKVLVDQTFKGKVKVTSPVTPETEMVQGPNDPYQKTKTAMMEGLSDLVKRRGGTEEEEEVLIAQKSRHKKCRRT